MVAGLVSENKKPWLPNPFPRLHALVTLLEPWGIMLAVLGFGFTLWAFAVERADREEDRINRALSNFASGIGRADALAVLVRNNVDLQSLKAPQAYLPGANLFDFNLLGADLSGANLEDADLRNATLIEADLRDANLNRADLNNALLIGADLRGANLIGADLGGAYLIGANLSGALLKGARLSRTMGDERTILPREYEIRDRYIYWIFAEDEEDAE